jgi:hypothetical protein
MANLTLKGRYFATVYGFDGSVKQHVEGENTVCTNGKEALARYLHSASTSGANPFKYIAVGTGTGAESAADTTLGTEIARHTGTASYSSGAIYSVTATFATNSAAGAITEYGLFTSNSVGTMFSRDVESVINVSATDTLTVTYQLTLS